MDKLLKEEILDSLRNGEFAQEKLVDGIPIFCGFSKRTQIEVLQQICTTISKVEAIEVTE